MSAGWAKEFYAGRQVLVTGGTSGIGLGLAQGFAAAGAKVLATGATRAEVEAAPAGEGLGFAELALGEDNGAAAGFVAPLKRLDVLVNCAGINLRQEEFAPETFARVLAVNLGGAMEMAVACRELLSAQGGAILNIASMFAFFGAGHAPGYAASKAGIVQLTRSLALAWAAEGIRVNALAPGWIETGMTAPVRADAGREAAVLARTPMGRWGQPEDLVGAGLFLCSPLAGFITGAVLPVDGGYLSA